MAFFDEFGAAELLFVGGLCFAMCLVVLLLIVLYFRRHGTVVVLELDGVSISYEGSIRTVQVSDLLADGRHGFDLLKRINSTLQLNSTYHDLSVFKNWDSPETSTQLDPRALLSTFLGEDDLRRAKTVPLLVERERFNVAGAFPWLYPVVHRDSLVSVAPGRSSCFGIAIGARVRKIVAPYDHMSHRSVVGASHSAGAPEGFVIATDVQGMAKVRWCDGEGHYIAATPQTPGGNDAAAAAAAVQQQLQRQPLETWEYWGRGGHFTITPADISIGVPPPTTAGDLSALRFASAAAAAAAGGGSSRTMHHQQHNAPSARHSPSTQHLTPAGVASGHSPRTLSGLPISGGVSQASRHAPHGGDAGVPPSVSTQPPSSGLSSTTDTTQSSTGPSTVRQDTAASAVSSTTTATTSSTLTDSRSQSRSSSATRTASRSSASGKKAAAVPASRRRSDSSSSSSSSSSSGSDSSSSSSSSRSGSSRSQSSSSRSTRRTRSGKSSKSSRNLGSRSSSGLRTSRGDSSRRTRTATGTEQTVSSLSATTDTLRQ